MSTDTTLVPKKFISHCLGIILSVAFIVAPQTTAQFRDDFSGGSLSNDPRGINGWTFFTGDGSARVDFSLSGKGYASLSVDATKDTMGIWWALIRRRVSGSMDLRLLANPKYVLRVEARIRLSHAPKRLNLHLNTQRTTNFHSHLMEFEIPDTTGWHVISMTTHGFDAAPGDTVYGQLALMDWGLEKYRTDIDYYRVDILNVDSLGPDQGIQVPYHPSIPGAETFAYHVPAGQDATIDKQYPDMVFNHWSSNGETGRTTLLSVSGTQLAILRWDLSAFAGEKVAGSGLLELTTHTLQRSPEYEKDFGLVRVAEIIGGDSAWEQKDVTYDTFFKGLPFTRVVNSQMIIDIEVNEIRGGKSFATISNPVLQRMIDGKTLGIVIRQLGAVNASFYAMENQAGRYSAKLHLNVVPDSSAVGNNR